TFFRPMKKPLLLAACALAVFAAGWFLGARGGAGDAGAGNAADAITTGAAGAARSALPGGGGALSPQDAPELLRRLDALPGQTARLRELMRLAETADAATVQALLEN